MDGIVCFGVEGRCDSNHNEKLFTWFESCSDNLREFGPIARNHSSYRSGCLQRFSHCNYIQLHDPNVVVNLNVSLR